MPAERLRGGRDFNKQMKGRIRSPGICDLWLEGEGSGGGGSGRTL